MREGRGDASGNARGESEDDRSTPSRGVGRAPGRRRDDGPGAIARRGRNRHAPFMLTVKAAMVPLRGRSVSLRASSSVTGRGATSPTTSARAFGRARPSPDAIFSRVTDGRSRPTRGTGSIAHQVARQQPIKSVVRNRNKKRDPQSFSKSWKFVSEAKTTSAIDRNRNRNRNRKRTRATFFMRKW